MNVRVLLFSTLSVGALASSPPLVFYTEDYPPFSYMASDRPSGINTEILRLVATELELSVEFQVVPWARAQVWTQAQDNACFFSAARTAEREQQYQWAGPLSTEYIALFSLRDDFPPLADFNQAVSYRIGGQTADFYTDWGEERGLKIERTTEIATNLLKLDRDRIDLWLAGSIGGPYIAASEGMTLHTAVQSAESFTLWLACNPEMDPQTVTAIDQTLQKFRSSGVVEGILESYR